MAVGAAPGRDRDAASAPQAAGLADCIAEAVAEVGQAEPADAEAWKRRGGEAYKKKQWKEAIQCYSAALSHCESGDDMATVCLNNRAACHAQLKAHSAVVDDASEVILRQPANIKALLRRMVAFDALGKAEDSLKDAASVLTMEPKNAHALQVVAKKRASLTKKGNEEVRRPSERRALCVFLFSEDSPLQCYSCLLALQKHIRGAILHVHVFWQAAEPACKHSYLLLQSLPEISCAPGSVSWIDASNHQLFPSFSRLINRLSVEGKEHVLMLSDCVLFHTGLDVRTAMKVLTQRREAFTVRLDLNPCIDHFPGANLFHAAPNLQTFAEDARIQLWTRSYDKSKQAFEAVPRESGWDEILDWTATIIRVEHVQHFFSALLPPLDTVKELDTKAADWLSRRQRMKRSELSHRSACFEEPLLVAVARSELGEVKSVDGALRSFLLKKHILDSKSSPDADGYRRLGAKIEWKVQEVADYFRDVDGATAADPRIQALFAPELHKQQYQNSTWVPALPSTTALPKPLNAPKPLVSWLIPVRNAEYFVHSCFESIVAQKGIAPGEWEAVFVEDCSEDGTLSALRKLAAANASVRVIENDARLGVAGSLAKGWQHCRGDFVARLDADDEADPERLMKQLRYLEQHPTISVVGSRTRPFWTETRKFTIERVSDRKDGALGVVAWREFHGNQTSRQREQLILREEAGRVLVAEGPAEYHGCRVLQVGEDPLALTLELWRDLLRGAQGGVSEVLIERRDPLEPPCGPRVFHPLLIYVNLLFEDSIAGTTAVFRRGHFEAGANPFPQEEAECHWAWLGLGPNRHAANLADPLVYTRRHVGNRSTKDAAGINESKCAAIRDYLARLSNVRLDLGDAAALLNFRGPVTTEQGEKLLDALLAAARSLVARYIRPDSPEEQDDFRRDFVQGREVALEHAILEVRARFKATVDEVSRVITKGDSPRQHRSRTPPR